MSYDRPRQPNEDAITWAISTQRIAAAGEANWRAMLAKGQVDVPFIESLATALPPDPEQLDGDWSDAGTTRRVPENYSPLSVMYLTDEEIAAGKGQSQ